jgi:hypothetical protein
LNSMWKSFGSTCPGSADNLHSCIDSVQLLNSAIQVFSVDSCA